MKKPMNDQWQFIFDCGREDFEQVDAGCFSHAETVRLPHTVKELPYSYANEKDYQTVCAYRKTFSYEDAMEGKRTFLCFAGAAHLATVLFNGQKLCTHSCGYTAFETELTRYLLPGENEIIVLLDTRETSNVPPFGFVIDYTTYGGLYREVSLEIREPNYIADVFVTTNGKNGSACLTFSDTLPKEPVKMEIFDAIGDLLLQKNIDASKDLLLQKNADTSLDITFSLENFSFPNGLPANGGIWDLEHPTLYTALFTCGACVKQVRFGFREIAFKKDGFYLNGKKIKLRGLNRHQSYPYVGYAMPSSMQTYDADILKDELGVNCVRTSHYPQSQHFIDRCDELGLLVFTEIPGWQHMGDEAWQDVAVENCREMVLQYRNHPSIILWGVRINESQDNDPFYTRTNEAAHALDPSRPTSGVRFFARSHLLEDVYAYNDFSYFGGKKSALRPKSFVTSDSNKAYFVSEFNGHMFPTKSYDDESHRVEHALRYANVLSAMYRQPDISGCFGWCMFDYNTHKDFGSGDRICHHGVMDMFRNPKAAAFVYQSQREDKPVLYVTSSMDIGEHPAGMLQNIYAFTNGDSVKLYKNEEFVGEFYPDRKNFSMPHPPVYIDDLIGEILIQKEAYPRRIAEKITICLNGFARYGFDNLPLSIKLKGLNLMLFHKITYSRLCELFSKYAGNWGGKACVYRFEAFKDGKTIATVTKTPVERLRLKTIVSSTVLKEAETYDTALVRIQAVDEYDNILPYANLPVSFAANGAVSVYGPDSSVLEGGMGGVYVSSIGKGNGTLEISSPGVEDVVIQFQVN